MFLSLTTESRAVDVPSDMARISEDHVWMTVSTKSSGGYNSELVDISNLAQLVLFLYTPVARFKERAPFYTGSVITNVLVPELSPCCSEICNPSVGMK